MMPGSDGSINIQLEMRDDSNKISYTGDSSIYINLFEGKINTDNPVWIDPSTSLTFPGEVDYKTIDIIIANSVNHDVWSRATGVRII